MRSLNTAAVATAPGLPAPYWLSHWATLRDALDAQDESLVDHAAVRPFEAAAALTADFETRHPALADLLRLRALPFRTPSAFVTGDDNSVIEATLALVLADAPRIRLRWDGGAGAERQWPLLSRRRTEAPVRQA